MPSCRYRAGRGDDHEGVAGLNELVATEAVLADDVCHVRGIVGDGIVAVDLHAQIFQSLLEGVHGTLTYIAVDDHATDVQSHRAEGVDQAKHLAVIGNAQVAAEFVVLNVGGVDGDDHLGILGQRAKHLQLTVGLEAGKHAGGVIVVEQLAAELHVELAAKGGDALTDLGGLQADIFLVGEAFLKACRSGFFLHRDHLCREGLVLPPKITKSPERLPKTIHK